MAIRIGRGARGFTPRARLDEGLAQLGLSLPGAVCEALLEHLLELEKWNAAYNLTAVRDPEQMLTRHLLDSLSIVPLLRDLPAGRLLDVGSGGGFPGLPLALALPEWHVTLLDSNGKKARFLRHASRVLEVPVEVVEARVEALPPLAAYDCIVSRAFASVADFVALTRPLLAPGGQWLAMKGKLDETELTALPTEVIIRRRVRLDVPDLPEQRHALILEVQS